MLNDTGMKRDDVRGSSVESLPTSATRAGLLATRFTM